MKQSILSLFILLFVAFQISAQKSINCLFEDMKDDDKSFALKLPGWILNTGLKYALADEDNNALNLLQNKIKQVRILVNENPTVDVENLIAKFKSKLVEDNLQLYASVKEKGSLINVYAEEKKDIIKNLFFLINGKNNIVLLHLKTKITLSDFDKANFTFKKKKNED